MDLKRLNPDQTIVACFGVPQKLNMPLLYPAQKYRRSLNWNALR
jgi:hypothetical protein